MTKTKATATDTTTFTLKLPSRTHEAIRYCAAIRGEAMHTAAAYLLARGISALRADPEWQMKITAYEARRAAGLAMLGVSAPDVEPLDDRSAEVQELVASQQAAAEKVARESE